MLEVKIGEPRLWIGLIKGFWKFIINNNYELVGQYGKGYIPNKGGD